MMMMAKHIVVVKISYKFLYIFVGNGFPKLLAQLFGLIGYIKAINHLTDLHL